MDLGAVVAVDRTDLGRLIAVLADLGFRVIGPTRQGASVVYGDIASDSDLPVGLVDQQEGGRYRLRQSGDARVFGCTVGQSSCKQYLFPARKRVWSAEMTETGLSIQPKPEVDDQPLAFLGVRACDLAAVRVQDAVFDGDYPDADYLARRRSALIVAVNCARAGGTCFCASMGSGPQVGDGHDLAMTELLGDGRHLFVVEVGSERGAGILARIPHRQATDDEIREVSAQIGRTKAQMGREMAAGGPQAVRANPEHPRWRDVAARCLTCGNCTLVCPTCFCSTSEDVTDLSGTRSERWQRWESCFTLDFSYIHGGSIRREAESRYRHWITHKLSTWVDQFGMSGCVGCGRCITWCPVGIDITEEARVIRDTAREA